jgi:hypothetical protein
MSTQVDSHAQQEDLLRITPLPRHFLLQMDNSWKDNKNWIVMAFCSQLVFRGVFETVQLSFLMVGHTHEDIDANFSKVSTRLRHREISTLLGLMAETWESESIHPVPYLIQEVADYKGYARPFARHLMGHSQPIQFLFRMRENKPIFQYKDTLSGPWLPAEGRAIWKNVADTNEIDVPEGEPKAAKMVLPHPKVEEIGKYLREYMKWLKNTHTDKESEGFRRSQSLLTYWNKVLDVLQGPCIDSKAGEPLKNGFWPQTNHGTGLKTEDEPPSLENV